MNWKKEYINKLGSTDINEADIEIAQTLKIDNLPKHLYKYRPFNKYSLSNLESDTVWLNIPAEYNDPFECVEYLDLDKISKAGTNFMKDEIIHDLTKSNPVPRHVLDMANKSDDPIRVLCEYQFRFQNGMAENVLEITEGGINKVLLNRHLELIKNLQNKLKICSFCESPNQLLMWSHYANHHKGFCIEYNIQSWAKSDIRNRILYPVIYDTKLYNSTNHFINQMVENTFNNLYPMISCATKSIEWGYEKEWRFIFNIGDSFDKQNYPMECQSRVFIGSRMNTRNRNKIIKICQSKKIPVFLAKPATKKYMVEFEPINI